MHVPTKVAIGFSALMFGALIVAADPAGAAMGQLVCKSTVQGSAYKNKHKSIAKTHAKRSWLQKVARTYGSFWAANPSARNQSYGCARTPAAGNLKYWTCSYQARPCKRTAPGGASKYRQAN